MRNSVKQLYWIVIFSFTMLLFGCIKEDLVSCSYTHYLTFEYTKNIEHIDKFPTSVNKLDVYVFDSNGKFVKHLTDQGEPLASGAYKMPVDLPSGEYTFVVWGGLQNCFTVFNGQEPESISDLGSSFFENLKLGLTNKTTIVDLFHGMARRVVLGSTSTTTHISLTKNTKTIYVTIKGLQNLYSNPDDYDSIELICDIANGELTFDNSISKPDELIQYIPISRIAEGEDLKFTIKTLRLLTNMQSMLSIKNTATAAAISSRSLVDLLLLLPNISSDEDFDINDEYDIVISIDANLGVSITVNGYLVVSSDLEVQ